MRIFDIITTIITAHSAFFANTSLPARRNFFFAACAPLALSACVTQPSVEAPVPQESAPSVIVAVPAAPAAPAPAPAPEPIVVPPSPDKIAALQIWVDQHGRLYRVAAPLLINNTELCERQARHLLGLIAKTRYSYADEFVSAARPALGLGERLRVMNVLKGGGAEQAGVRKGDILLEIESQALPEGRHAERDSAALVSAAMQDQSSVEVTVLRDGKKMFLNIPLTHACAFSVELGDANNINSYADGHRVMITRGMLEFVQSDKELAYVLAKEIAHNILSSSPRPDIAAVIDQSFLASARAPQSPEAVPLTPYSPVLDATADKLALYLLARAGYDIDDAASFWKRLSTKVPAQIENGHTALHPSTSYRLSVMNQVTKMIHSKKAHKMPLVP